VVDAWAVSTVREWFIVMAVVGLLPALLLHQQGQELKLKKRRGKRRGQQELFK
jgi:hypothetical protein